MRSTHFFEGVTQASRACDHTVAAPFWPAKFNPTPFPEFRSDADPLVRKSWMRGTSPVHDRGQNDQVAYAISRRALFTRVAAFAGLFTPRAEDPLWTSNVIPRAIFDLAFLRTKTYSKIVH